MECGTTGATAVRPNHERLPLVLDHVGLVVEDLDSALERYATLLGGAVNVFEDDEPLDCRWGNVTLPGSVPIELLSPRSEASPYRAFLDQRGEGLHHLSFRIDDLDAERERMKRLGLDVLGLCRDHGGWQEFFLHPRETHRALLHFGVPPRS